ncbi:MAG TPA: response regulator transcription factor [Sphingobacteriaceae bacterium]|nr:response regulator transcription factor [Sphingobacteriaceae bacterium]
MSEQQGKIKVLIVDDHEVVRMGLKSLVDRQPDMEWVGEAGNVAEAVEKAKATEPHVVILDVRLPDGSGIDACRDIRSHNDRTRIIMLTSYADDEALFASIVAGASGYILKQTRGSELMEAVRRVARGESLLDPAVTHRVLERIRGGDRTGPTEGELLARLTDRERHVLELIAKGYTNRQIGEALHLSEKTIKHYVTGILNKLGVDNRTAAAALLGEQRGRL